MTRFKADMVTDAKRLVRGEHWRYARTVLRRRDEVHHLRWNILTLAGEHPQEEIGCIRELMHKAQIVAVDQNPAAVQAAENAGADVALQCNLRAFRDSASHDHIARLPEPVARLAPFDVINLDLCCDVLSAIDLIRYYSHVVTKHGVLMATFSYGRDVVEIFDPGDFGNVPAPLGGRVRKAAEAARGRVRIASVLAYPGNRMPMCACLWEGGQKFRPVRGYDPQPRELLPPKSFQRVGNDDLYAAVTMFDRIDPQALYGLPDARILSFRRKLAAAKAVATRRKRKSTSNGVDELVRSAKADGLRIAAAHARKFSGVAWLGDEFDELADHIQESS